MALGTLILTLLGLGFIYFVALGLYNVYLHPLRKFPGPWLNRAFELTFTFSFMAGREPFDLKRMHERYGNVVRFMPNHVSFISPEARQEIYGHQAARTFEKDPGSYRKPPDGVNSILSANDVDHSRFRRLLSHAFSSTALREQEELVNTYVDLLIQRLHERSGQTVDIVKWYNYATFDIVGDLAFGEPFGCLSTGEYHPWVALIFESIRAVATLTVLQSYINLERLLLLLPSKGMEKRKYHTALVKEKVAQRLERETTRPDFMKYILRHNDEKGMNRAELESNSSLLILAGSETTATALSGTTYHLLRNPEAMQKLVSEIRGRFHSVAEMTTEQLANCTYLNNVLQEGLRVYPPVPVGLPRRVAADGAVVAGYTVPKGAVVSLSNYPSYSSARNFTDADRFVPERWSTGAHEKPSKYDTDQKTVFEPFSVGPRNCIGKNLAWIEMRLILARVLFEFDLTLVDDGWNPKHQEIYVLWQKPALNVRCTARKR